MNFFSFFFIFKKKQKYQVIFHPDSECLRTVAETPVLDDLRIV